MTERQDRAFRQLQREVEQASGSSADRELMSAKGRRGGLARAARQTPEERSAISKRAAEIRWARWRERNGVAAPEETSSNRRPAEGIEAYLDEVLREHPSWSFAQARREASIRQRKASADLAWEVLKAKRAGQ